MERIFRLLILVAVVASVILVVMPFEHPVTATIPLQGSAALLNLCTVLLLLVGTVSCLVSAAGLLAFRAWARPLARWATIALLAATVLLGRFTPSLQVLSPWSIAVAILALGCWLGALVLAYSLPVSARFLTAR